MLITKYAILSADLDIFLPIGVGPHEGQKILGPGRVTSQRDMVPGRGHRDVVLQVVDQLERYFSSFNFSEKQALPGLRKHVQ